MLARHRWKWIGAFGLGLLLSVVGWGSWATVPTLFGQGELLSQAWVELGPEAIPLARVITTAKTCPDIRIDQQLQAMTVHGAANVAFPVMVCEATIPPGTTQARIGTSPLALPKAKIEKILVVGDTGCRLKGKQFQACNDPQAWPWATIAHEAAAWQPDLIIHVGDYYYREAPCPAGHAGCVGSPWGDNWPAWNADFFTPAQPLLSAAPWVFLRGNHELCSRGGQGWFHFLDPRPQPTPCSDYTPAYQIPLSPLNLIVLDSAAAEDLIAQPTSAATYREQLSPFLKINSSPTWLLTHRPVWGIGEAAQGTLYRINATLQQAVSSLNLTALNTIFSGHIHLYQSLNFGADPRQIIVGNSGTELNEPIITPLVGKTIAGKTIQSSQASANFGYMTLTANNEGWQAQAWELNQQPLGESFNIRTKG
ncbi:metallophosphoesterase [Thermosynechococcaceae cyanobacterium BACA0444]|uniref:Metallophosphoesterase n=1 Tax=Pseudocalidococcus azoricus BACA0444 TaxID=2918990 RepID=A0AAE4FUC0_9CYAN|nr:metallophosphoesterase [Pseudocalidococcus azoricus]MDS3861111.1 metallophosphoesterase [Pseudocalidococcus azoricus BACA0444]